MRTCFWGWMSFLCLVCVIWAAGDTLILKNGHQIVGSVLAQNQKELLIEVKGIQLKVRKADVVSFIQDGDVRPMPSTQIPSSGTIQFATGRVESTTQTIFPSETPTETPSETPFNGMEMPQPVIADSSSSEQATQGDVNLPLLPLLIPRGETYQISGTNVRFRKGPDLSYPVIQQLRSQTILLEIETVDNWLHAKTLEGQKGWTHTNFVKPIDSTPCLVTGANLNVREMPGEVYRSLARLRKGEIVLKLGEQGDWFHVLYEGQIAGYCHKDYLQPFNDPAVYKPPMQAIRNESVGQPIRVQVSGDGILERTLVFTVLDDQIVLHGSTKILILHSNKDIFASDRTQYTSEDIIKRQRLESSSAIVNSGLPEELGITYIGADVLTMLGHRVDQNWQYDLTLPAEEGIEFAFLVQKGPSRGTVILVQP